MSPSHPHVAQDPIPHKMHSCSLAGTDTFEHFVVGDLPSSWPAKNSRKWQLHNPAGLPGAKGAMSPPSLNHILRPSAPSAFSPAGSLGVVFQENAAETTETVLWALRQHLCELASQLWKQGSQIGSPSHQTPCNHPVIWVSAHKE